jgi:hypothetical protein
VYAAGLDNEVVAGTKSTLATGGKRGVQQPRRVRTCDASVPTVAASSNRSTATSKESNPCADTKVTRLHQNHHTGFRGDSHWTGIALLPADPGGSDLVVGVCDTGSVYIVKNAEHMGGTVAI